MIRYPGPLPEISSQKGLAELNRQLYLLFNSGNFSGGTGGGSGGGSSATAIWTTATRPALPGYGITGYNTTLSAQETYTPLGWFINGGRWTNATRPTGMIEGSWGWNTDIPSREYWDGAGWNQG